jgi:DNA-binding MurR/RpiR family transcriptional regulator
MGFTSFSDLKDGITSALFPSDLNARDLEQDLNLYRVALDSGIQRMFMQMEQTVDNEVIEGLAQELHRNSHITLACAGNTSGVLNRFQQELFFAGKLTNDYESRLTRKPAQITSLLVVVSASGVFARSFDYLIRQVDARKVLITANLELLNWDAYDRVLCLSEDQEGRDALGIYGKYGVSYFFDLLSSSYLHLFGSPIST